jgi:hypothetical protein
MGIQSGERSMTMTEHTHLLREARTVLERFMFDGEDIRDDVAEVCAKLDDVLLGPAVIEEADLPASIERAA